MVPFHSQLLGSVGSQQSCVAQGFLSTFFYSLSALSNASLAVAYCLIVRLGWKDKDKSKNRLPFVLTPFLISIVLAVAPLFGSNYNYNAGYSCYIRLVSQVECMCLYLSHCSMFLKPFVLFLANNKVALLQDASLILTHRKLAYVVHEQEICYLLLD